MSTRRPPSPAERVRERLRAVAGDRCADAMPRGYQRLGRVLVLRLPSLLRPYRELIGRAWQQELGVTTVLAVRGPVEGELRTPQLDLLAGAVTETEVVEHGCRWRFDAARILFARGTRTERARIGSLVRPGEEVLDLFAGIGYFTVPAARAGAHVVAVEKNPVSIRYLTENLARNGIADRVTVRAGDNRVVPLPVRSVDRVLLGYLPDALPWVPRALSAVRSTGGVLHVHRVVDARDAVPVAERSVAEAVGAADGVLLAPPAGREVKPYGPGRTHVVVDVRARPPPAG